jgi:predicted ATP-dependent serine protease
MVNGEWWLACAVRVASSFTYGRLMPTQSVVVGEASPPGEVWMVENNLKARVSYSLHS